MLVFYFGKENIKLSTTFRWLVPILLIMVFVFFVSYRGLVQNTATRSTAEVEALNEVIETGTVRGEFDDRAQQPHFDKDELIANVIAHVVTSQKAHGFDVNVDYVFLDAVGKITTDDSKIRGIQFRIEYWKDGERKATSEKRISLHGLTVKGD